MKNQGSPLRETKIFILDIPLIIIKSVENQNVLKGFLPATMECN